MIKRTFARIILISNLIFFAIIVVTNASVNEQPVPNYTEGGIDYNLSGPDTYATEIYLLNTEHSVNITDAETLIIEWETEVPDEIISKFSDSFSYNGATVNRHLSVFAINTLTLNYSKNAFIEGQPFISGQLLQKVHAVEYMSANGLTPFSYKFGFTDTITRNFISGNFSSLTDDNTLTIPLIFSANEITNQYAQQSLQAYSKLSQYYAELEEYDDLEMDMTLPLTFIAEIIEDAALLPANELTGDIPINTPSVEIIEEADLDSIVTPLESQAELPPPATAEVIASAISSAIAVGVVSSAAASTGSSVCGVAASGAASSSAVVEHTAKTVIQSAAVSAGKGVLSFISDIIKGLRDMFMDEGRAHASGKVSENFHKE